MARPSKYTPELSKRIVHYLSDGLTIRDVCYGAGISEDTFCRWRREKPEFAEAIRQATANQEWSSEALARASEYRRYRRKQKYVPGLLQNKPKGNLIRLLQNKPILGHFNAPERHIAIQYDPLTKLPIRSGISVNKSGKLVACEPYVNSESGCVEWVDEYELTGNLVRRICSREVWARKALLLE